MSEADCLAALSIGAAALANDELDLLVLGEMGIGNSTAASALCARSFGGTAAEWAGPGTGMDATGIERKAEVVTRGLAFHADGLATAFDTLRRQGGRDIAAIAGPGVAERDGRARARLEG